MKKYFAIVLALVCALSCIKNDIPYPTVEARITSMTVSGAEAVTIDAAARTVQLTLSESVDLSSVEISSVTYSSELVVPSIELVGTHDLTSPLEVTLTTYSDYLWTITASQTITRSFVISGQVGESIIDVENRTATATVPNGTDLSNLRVSSLKLGPEGLTSYSPSMYLLTDFSEPREVTVSYRDVTEVWTLSVEVTETSVYFDAPDVWTRVIWLRASGIEGRENGFQIRRAGTEEWAEVSQVSNDGGVFTACAEELEPLTEYEVRAYSGEDVSAIRTVTTEEERQVPNAGFETFSNAESSKYYSFYDPSSSDPELQTKWWCSGNKGATTLSSSHYITTIDPDEKAQGEYSARLQSRYVIIKFAAGNIFSGEYNRTIGISGGEVYMGRPFTLRPRKVTLSWKYQSGKITDRTIGDVPDGETIKAGDNDRACVWVALGTWDYNEYDGTPDSPVRINTTDKSTFFNSEGPDVVAYGRAIATESVEEWTRVEIPLEYATTSVRPTHIIISCAASMLGDYFTGSEDSVLWIDDIRLEY